MRSRFSRYKTYEIKTYEVVCLTLDSVRVIVNVDFTVNIKNFGIPWIISLLVFKKREREERLERWLGLAKSSINVSVGTKILTFNLLDIEDNNDKVLNGIQELTNDIPVDNTYTIEISRVETKEMTDNRETKENREEKLSEIL